MTASVILAHPYEKSFNHAIYAKANETFRKLEVKLYSHDLYKESFDPVLTTNELGKEKTKDRLVEQCIHEMMESNVMVFIHPNWWGQPPAMMKGYIDRVFRPPYAYDFDENASDGGLPTPKLTDKIGIVFNTSNTEAQRENDYFHDPLEHEWLRCVFGFCGIETSYRKMYRVVSDSTERQRSEWLDDVEATLRRYIVQR